MSKFKEGDVIALQIDLPDDGLARGALGTIVCCFTEPDMAFEAEFADEEGRTLAQVTLHPGQFSLATLGGHK